MDEVEIDDEVEENDTFLNQALDDKKMTTKRYISQMGGVQGQIAKSTIYGGSNDNSDDEVDLSAYLNNSKNNNNHNSNTSTNTSNNGSIQKNDDSDVVNDAENEDEFLASDVLGPKRRRYNPIVAKTGELSILNDSDDELDETELKLHKRYQNTFDTLFRNENQDTEVVEGNGQQNRRNRRRNRNSRSNTKDNGKWWEDS